MTDQAVTDLKRLAADIHPADLDRDPLLLEREKTHGSYKDVAQLSQQLKMLFRKYGAAKTTIDVRQAESLEMIAVKLARILCGNANEPDHWRDIAGYAKLAEEACKGG